MGKLLVKFGWKIILWCWSLLSNIVIIFWVVLLRFSGLVFVFFFVNSVCSCLIMLDVWLLLWMVCWVVLCVLLMFGGLVFSMCR